MRTDRGVRTVAASIVMSTVVLLSLSGCAKVKVNAGPSSATASTTASTTAAATSTTQPAAGGLDVTTTTPPNSTVTSGGSVTTPLGAPAGGSTLAAAVATGDPCAVHAAVIALSPTADAATLSAAAAALTAVKGAVDRAVVTDWMWLSRDFAKRAAIATDLASQRAAAIDPDAEAVELRVAAAMDRDCPT